MKIRADFVTNSSSSSFVTVHCIKKNGETIECSSRIDDNGFNDALALKLQNELDDLVKKTAGNGEELIKALDDIYNGLLLSCLDSIPVTNIKNVDAIRAVKSFDELKEIVLMDEYTGAEGPTFEMTYRYDVNSGKSQQTMEPKDGDFDEYMDFDE